MNIECPSTILRSEQARTASFQQTPAKLQEPEACQRLLAFKALSGYFNFFLDFSRWFSMFPVSSKVNRLNRWWSATLPASRRSLGLLHLSVTWGMFASALKPCPGFRTPFTVASLLEEEVLHLSPKMPQTPLAILIYLTELAHTGQWWNMRRHRNDPKLSFSIIVSQCPRGQCKNM